MNNAQKIEFFVYRIISRLFSYLSLRTPTSLASVAGSSVGVVECSQVRACSVSRLGGGIEQKIVNQALATIFGAGRLRG